MLRRSLLEPVPQLDQAATLLDAAADAVTREKLDLARDLIAQADMPEIATYSRRLLGRMSMEWHRHTRRPKCLPKTERHPDRMPSASVQDDIFARDGWRCRFCGTRVVCKRARRVFVKLFGPETRWKSPEFQRHAALYAMASSLDHILPHGRGGKNEIGNLVTACYCCQFGRGEWTLDEVQLQDPRQYPPVVDAWDGLSRLRSVRLPKVEGPHGDHQERDRDSQSGRLAHPREAETG